MAKNKEYELAIKIAGEIEKSFYNSTKLTKKELQEIAKQASQTSSSVSETFSKGLKDAAPVFDGMASAGKAAFEAVATAATIAATAVAAVVAASVSVGASFEAQMSTVQAISGASASDMEKLNDLAKELGASTKYTATEVGQAMEYMAMAGWKTNDMLDGMAGVLSLASASGEDLAITSDIVTDAMTAFGLGADQVEHFADVLAATATNSNTTVSMMGETFTYAASIAGAMGYSIEDVSVAIGLMANSGIKASQAGTALRKILTETTGGATTTSAALGEYVIQTQNADGSMRELGDTIADLRYAFSQMTEAEKAANAEAIAGKTGMSGLLAIVNASEADYQKLTSAIYDCQGAAEEMANIRIDNLSGDITIMQSALEGLGIQIYEDINEPLRTGVQWFTELIGKASTKLTESGIIANLSAKIPTAVRKIKELTSAVADFSKPFFDVAGWMIDNPGVIVGAIAAVGTAIATYKISSGIMSIATALGSLGPVGWSIMAIGAVVGIIAGIGTAVKKSAQEAKRANLAAHFGNIALSLEELEEVAGFIVSNDSLGQLREAISAFEGLEEVQRALDDSISTINKMNWKVSIGMELSPDEQEQYQSEIAEYVTQCQQYVQDKQYAINLAVGILTDDDLEGNSITTQINNFYASKQQELADLGTKLNETITEAFQDGLLDMDEVAEITQLQEQMARIQSAIAGSNFDANLNLLELKYDGGALDAETFQNLQAEIQEQMDLAIADYDEAYTLSVANAKIMLDDGAINASEYQRMVEEFKENYLEQIGELEAKSLSFQLNTITQAYSDEIGVFNEHMSEVMQEYTDETYMVDWEMRPVLMWDAMAQEIWNSDIDKTTKEAIAELLETMEPSLEQIEELKAQYKELGMELPAELEQAIMNADTLGAMTVYQKVWGQAGDMQALYDAMSQQLVNDPRHAEIVEMLKGYGWELPEAYAQAVSENKEVMETASSDLYDTTRMYLYNNFLPGFDVETDVRIQMNPIYDSNGNLTGPYSNEYIQQFGKAPFAAHAEGGIFSTPHYGVFAEDGMEAFIPIDGSQRAMDLWEQTGQLLGVNGIGEQEDSFSGLSRRIMDESTTSQDAQTGVQSGSITYAPTLQFYGDAPDRKELDEALALSQEKFEEMMEKYISNNRRLNFAWEG